MGRDAILCVKTIDGREPDSYLDWRRADNWQRGAGWQIDLGERYYGQFYERGRWPHIARTILGLLGNRRVEKIWYASHDGGDYDRVTPEFFEAECRRWMAHENRPYTEDGYRGSDAEKADIERLGKWVHSGDEEVAY